MNNDSTILRPLTVQELAVEETVDIGYNAMTSSKFFLMKLAEIQQEYAEKRRPYNFRGAMAKLEDLEVEVVKGKLNVDLHDFGKEEQFELVKVIDLKEKRLLTDQSTTSVVVGKQFTFVAHNLRKVIISEGTTKVKKVSYDDKSTHIMTIDNADLADFEKWLKSSKVKGFELLDR